METFKDTGAVGLDGKDLQEIRKKALEILDPYMFAEHVKDWSDEKKFEYMVKTATALLYATALYYQVNEQCKEAITETLEHIWGDIEPRVQQFMQMAEMRVKSTTTVQ